MPDPGFLSLADSLVSFSSVVFFIFIGAVLLILWQVLIVVGAMIANLMHRDAGEETGPVNLA